MFVRGGRLFEKKWRVCTCGVTIQNIWRVDLEAHHVDLEAHDDDNVVDSRNPRLFSRPHMTDS